MSFAKREVQIKPNPSLVYRAPALKRIHPDRKKTRKVRAVGAGSASKARKTPKRYESALQVWINQKTHLETITAICFFT